MQNELRKSYDLNSWALMSPIEPSAVGCPLCPAPEDKTETTFSINNDKGKWITRSIVDPYPYTHPSMFKLKEDAPLFESFSAHGWSEIVVETREHTKELHELTSEEIKNVLTIYKTRIKELRKRENVEFVGILKDNLHTEFVHSYSRIFTLPILPNTTKSKITRFNDYQFKNERCIYCDILKKESSRVVFQNNDFAVFTPFSPTNNFEVWIMPKKHRACISELEDYEIFNLAETIKNILTRMSVALEPFRYSMVFHLKANHEKDFHFHIQIFQKTIRSSLKEGYDINLCKLSPESVAKILRGK